ncbi:MAG: hypothetical protein U0821_27575 [Chloroflexota bacterium]
MATVLRRPGRSIEREPARLEHRTRSPQAVPLRGRPSGTVPSWAPRTVAGSVAWVAVTAAFASVIGLTLAALYAFQIGPWARPAQPTRESVTTATRAPVAQVPSAPAAVVTPEPAPITAQITPLAPGVLAGQPDASARPAVVAPTISHATPTVITDEHVIRQTIIDGNAAWAAAVGGNGSNLERFFGGSYLQGVAADIKETRERGLRRSAVLRDFSVASVRYTNLDSAVAETSELWEDRTLCPDGSLARDASGRLAQTYELKFAEGAWLIMSGSIQREAAPRVSACRAAEPTAAPRAPVATAVPAPTAAPSSVPRIGLRIESPRTGESVAQRLTARGTVQKPVPAGYHLRMIVRAHLPGVGWYMVPGEIKPAANGAWTADLFLGGGAELSHELRVGLLDDGTNSEVERFMRDQPGRPLQGWEIHDWWDETSVVVKRK